MLREVNSLSRVSHQHIVRYYSCWLEEVGPQTRSPADDSTDPSLPTSTAVSSEGEDIFAVNFDDLSVSRRDHSRSASFPRIRFAADSDEDDDDDDEDSSYESDGTIPDPSASEPPARSKAISVPSKPTASYTGTTTDDGTVQRILYIQMEFVEKVSCERQTTTLTNSKHCAKQFQLDCRRTRRGGCLCKYCKLSRTCRLWESSIEVTKGIGTD